MALNLLRLTASSIDYRLSTFQGLTVPIIRVWCDTDDILMSHHKIWCDNDDTLMSPSSGSDVTLMTHWCPLTRYDVILMTSWCPITGREVTLMAHNVPIIRMWNYISSATISRQNHNDKDKDGPWNVSHFSQLHDCSSYARNSSRDIV
jgi:hypothetical protein